MMRGDIAVIFAERHYQQLPCRVVESGLRSLVRRVLVVCARLFFTGRGRSENIDRPLRPLHVTICKSEKVAGRAPLPWSSGNQRFVFRLLQLQGPQFCGTAGDSRAQAPTRSFVWRKIE